MALTILPPPPDDIRVTIDDWLAIVVAFVVCALGGFTLMAVLSLSIWPAIFPYTDNLLQGSGLTVSLFIAFVCGIAGVIMAAARQTAR
ncbi:MAG TPA: hypothetical protein VNA12_06735 [Mycobacteriales bacterium]|nr:hypothetical protein [Mycobacteriales bacterium]